MQRKNEISFLNVIFCFLVVLIHILSGPVTSISKETWQYGVVFAPWRLSAFVVQGFIFLSGLKMFIASRNISYGRYCISRFFTIVLPYVIAVFGFYLFFVWKEYFPFSFKDLAGYILKGDLVSHFYFVIIIVQFYLLKPVWEIVVKKLPAIVAIVISVILMFLCKYLFNSYQYTDRIFTTYLPYWVMGCYAGKYYTQVINHLEKFRKAYFLQFLIIAIIEYVASYTQFVYGGMKFLEELHFIYCISAILFIFSASTAVCNSIMKFKLFKKVDSSSYYIYLIHPLFIFLTDALLVRWGINDIVTGLVIRGAVTYGLSISISILYLEIKKNLKRKRQCQNSEKQA